ncbi:MAG: F0F1 ATP synthase subunit epsilon [Acidobacteria bacterium]|nr:F0F1 ATP synthase subunit epsilon [Acidobacteriota bacterium]
MTLPTHLTLELVTPDHAVAHEEVDEVEIPGADGYFGVLPGHTPLLAMLSAGVLSYRKGPDRAYVSVAFGFAEVQPDRVTILAQVAERAEEVDVARAEAARKRAEARMQDATANVDFERARIALLRSLVRLQAAERARMRR